MNDLVRMFGLVRPYRFKLALATAASVIYAAFRLKLASLVKPLIDVEFKADAASPAAGPGIPISVVIVLVFLGSGIFAYVSQYVMHFVGQNVVRDLRDRLFESIEFQTIPFFNARSTGVLLSRMINDIERIQIALSEKVCDLLKEVPTVIFFVGWLLLLDPFLALVTFAAAPLVVYPIVKMGQRLRHISHRSQERMGELSALLHETITGIRIVKAFCMERFELSKFRKATRRLVNVNLGAVRLVAALPPLMEFLGGVAAALIILYGTYKIRTHQLTAGEFASFLTVLFMLYTPIKKLSRVNADVQQAMAASQRVFRIIDRKGEGSLVDAGTALSAVRGEIRFEQVSFAYDAEEVLSAIDLSIPAGSMVALVGSSGAGKTTLASLIPRFFEPSKGRISIDGIDIASVSLSSLRTQLGMVSQDVVLFNDTVTNNITCGREATPAGEVVKAARAANAHDFIEALPEGYDTVVGEKGVRLSGGQRQRLAIARALLKNPPILILDEATSSLDAESERLVQEAMGRLIIGRTVLVIAHRLSTIRSADRIVVLEDGRIVESGTHGELMALNGYYQRYCALQNEQGMIDREGDRC